MKKAIACVLWLVLFAAPQSAFADDDPWVDGLVGAFGGMTLFPDNAYAGSFGPQLDLVFGPQRWHVRPLVGGGASFNVGPAPYDLHLRVETGAALSFLGGAELGLGSVFVPQEGALEWSTVYLGLKKAILAAPIADPAGGSRDTGIQFELGPYFRYHMNVADDDTPVFPAAGIMFGISRK